MGTNYYYYMNVCKECKKPEHVMHIGKSSAGWTFGFRGYEKYEAEDYGIKAVINSAKKWKYVFAEYAGHIEDEYGREISREDFWDLVKKKKNAELNHTKECGDYGNKDILDGDGNAFGFCEFS